MSRWSEEQLAGRRVSAQKYRQKKLANETPEEKQERLLKEKAKGKIYREKNRERLNNYNREWRALNRTRHLPNSARYRERNIEKIRESQKEHKRKMRAEDPEFFRKYYQQYHFYRKSDADARTKQFLASIRQRTHAKELGFDLDDHFNEIRDRVAKWRCEISGVKLVTEANKTHPRSISIDRIDSKLGYLYSNIRINAWGLNAAFSHWGEEETARLMRRWLDIRDLA